MKKILLLPIALLLLFAANAQKVTTFAGGGTNGGSNVSPLDSVSFGLPYGLAVDKKGNIFVSDFSLNIIGLITPGGTYYQWAGSGGTIGFQKGNGSGAQTANPMSMVSDSNSNIYFIDYNNSAIRMLSAEKSLSIAPAVTTIAGGSAYGGSQSGFNNATGMAALFNYPIGLGIDKQGNLIVADQGNYLIRKITPAGVTTNLAGKYGSSGSADGDTNSATFTMPVGICVDSKGNIYVADNGGLSGSEVREITFSKSGAATVSTLSALNGTLNIVNSILSYGDTLLIGNGYNIIKYYQGVGFVWVGSNKGAYGYADGNGYVPRFKGIGQMAFSKDMKSIYVADSGNQRIRQVQLSGSLSGIATRDIIMKKVAISPNPASGYITISGESRPANVVVYDITGKEVINTHVEFDGSPYRLPTENLENGNYILSIQAKDYVANGKFVISK